MKRLHDFPRLHRNVTEAGMLISKFTCLHSLALSLLLLWGLFQTSTHLSLSNVIGFMHTFSVAQSCPTLLHPHGLQPTRLFCPWDFPGKKTRVGCHFLLQGSFPTQGSNQYLLHWQADITELPRKPNRVHAAAAAASL